MPLHIETIVNNNPILDNTEGNLNAPHEFGRRGIAPGYLDIALAEEDWDITPDWIVGDEETIQRLKVRLLRELGEWFLDIDAGLPWYQRGKGMLGAKPVLRRNIELVLRRCVLQTEGIVRITYFNTSYTLDRKLTLILTVLLNTGATATYTISAD